MLGINKIIKEYPATSFIFTLLIIIHIIDMFFIHFYPNHLEYRQIYLTASTFNFNIKSIIISSLTHNDHFHLFRNLFMMSLGGPILEKKVGSKQLFIVFIIAAITGIIGFLSYASFNSMHADVRGSSGGTFAVFGIGFSILLYHKFKFRVGFSVLISVLFISIAEFLKVTMGLEQVASTYRVMVAHISGLLIGYIVVSSIYYVSEDDIDIGLYSFKIPFDNINILNKIKSKLSEIIN